MIYRFSEMWDGSSDVASIYPVASARDGKKGPSGKASLQHQNKVKSTKKRKKSEILRFRFISLNILGGFPLVSDGPMVRDLCN